MARSPISARTMRSLRALDASAMPDTATLTRPGAPIPNGRGGTTPGAATTRTLAGRFANGSGEGVGQQGKAEDDTAELVRRGATARYKVAVDEDVRETDELTFGGDRYNVVYVAKVSTYSSSKLIGLKLISPAT